MQNSAYTTISRGGQVSCYISSQAVVPSFQVTGRYQGLDITYLGLNHVFNCSTLFCKREAHFSVFFTSDGVPKSLFVQGTGVPLRSPWHSIVGKRALFLS